MEPPPEYETQPPDREHLHRLTNVFAANPLYFITCCTVHRRRILANAKAAGVISHALRDSSRVHGWVVGRYVVMPDHVHFFARAGRTTKSISAFVRDWKRWTAAEIMRQSGLEPPIWQAEFFDHVIRSAQSYAEKWEYVRQNPVRAALASKPESWPHTGECEVLRF